MAEGFLRRKNAHGPAAEHIFQYLLVVCFRNSRTKNGWVFSQGKARGGDIAGSMATTSNAAMHPHDPDAMALHITLFGTEFLEPEQLRSSHGGV